MCEFEQRTFVLADRKREGKHKIRGTQHRNKTEKGQPVINGQKTTDNLRITSVGRGTRR